MDHGLYNARIYRIVSTISNAELAAILPVFIVRERVVIILFFINNFPGSVALFF